MALSVNGSTHPIPAYYSFIDPERMKGWVVLVGWPVADGLPTSVVTHQLQVDRRTGKVRQSETDVLPLCHATNSTHYTMLYPQNGDRITTTGSVTSFRPMYRGCLAPLQCQSKKQDTKPLPVTSPNINRFSFFSLTNSVVNLQQNV